MSAPIFPSPGGLQPHRLGGGLINRTRRLRGYFDGEAIDGVRRLRIGPLGRRITQIAEFAHVAQAAMGAGDPHRRSMQVGLRAGAALVEHVA